MSKPKPAFAIKTGTVSFGKVDEQGRMVIAESYEPPGVETVDLSEVNVPVHVEFAHGVNVPIVEFNIDETAAQLESQIVGTLELPVERFVDFTSSVWGFMKLNGIWVEVLNQPKQLEDGTWSIRIMKPPLHPDAVEELGLEERIKAPRRE